MKAAPHGAHFFIRSSDSFVYYRLLTKHVARLDINLYKIDELDYANTFMLGDTIIIDHAIELTELHTRILNHMQQYRNIVVLYAKDIE